MLRDHSTAEPRSCASTNNMENQSNPSEQCMKGERIRKYRVGETMNTLRSLLKFQKFQRGLNHTMQSFQEGRRGREPWGARRGAQRATTQMDDRAQLCDAESWAGSYRHRQRDWWERQDQGEEKDLIKTDWKNKAKNQILYLLWKHLKFVLLGLLSM